MTAPADPRRYAPHVVCEYCGKGHWRVVRSRMSERSVSHLRVRVYSCATAGCPARLYTHERVARAPQILTPIAWDVIVTLRDHPCPCGSPTFLMVARRDPSGFPLMRYSYTCQTCASERHTAEFAEGQTAGPTPRALRGRRRHPFLP